MVVLAPVEIEAADERTHGAVLRVGRDKGALGLRELDDLPIVMLVFLDANHRAAPDPAGRWGSGIEHALGELEPLPGHGDGFPSTPIGCHPFRRRLQNEGREEVVAVKMVLQRFLVVLFLCILEIDETLGAAIAVAPVVLDQT